MMKLIRNSFLFLLFAQSALAAAPFDSVSLQGFLKTSSGVPVNGTFNGRVSLLQNSIPCWNTGVTLVPVIITDGAFSKTLTGGVSSGVCSGTLGSSHFLVTGPFTWTLDLDIDGNGAIETTFSNIPITAVPLAMVAETVTGSVPAANISAGTFGVIDGSNLTNLTAANLVGALPAVSGSALTNINAGNISSGTVGAARLGSGTASATTFLRGDNSWQSLPAAGETNTASNLGTGSPSYKQKIGADLQFRSLLAGSTKLSLVTNLNDITFDVNDANLALSGTQVSGGTFGAIDGSALTNLTAGNISTGTVSTARLGSGTASATTFLRGDSTWQTLAAAGETNTASNLGTGSQVYKQKAGVDLQLRSLLAGSTKLSLTTNLNDITFDVNDANLALSGTQVSGGTFGAVNGSALTNLSAANLSTGTVVTARLGSGIADATSFLRGDSTWQTLAAPGETNTASNLGAGSQVYKQKIGADLQLRSLVAGSTKLALTTGLNDISFDINDANLLLSGTQVSGGTFGAVDGSALTNLSAANLSTGTVGTARLGSGTASATTFLRGDSTWQTIAAAGETNTASNLGTGSQVYKQKVGVDLQLRSLLAGSTKLSLTSNLNDITFDVNDANLAVSGTQVSGGTFGAVNGSALTNLSAANLSTGTVGTARLGSGTADATSFLRGDSTWQTLAAPGETNTASNLGTGSQVYKQKVGVDLQMRSLVAGSTKLSLTTNLNDITLNVIDANLLLSGTQVSGGTFGAVDASALTNLPAANLVGTLPALNAAALTSLDGTNIAAGTVNSARLPQAAAAADGIITSGAQTIGGAKTFNGAVTMASALTNNGVVAWTKTDVASVATINCLASTTPVVRLTGTTITALNGISPGADGQILVLYTDGNIGTGLTIAHNNAGGCVNGKIFTATAANIVSTTALSTAAFVFMYNLGSLRWHLISALQ